ncbi:MAG TPA: MOSC domain-containing protein, partial [Xanthomonadales bacterium]|nr:MOSC domain-containing protein [Xanthomonadales bacterium]
FDVVKPCVRCVFTTVDGARGAFDPSGEPLKTLKSYRRSPKGITFGQNLIPRGKGEIRVGDAVEVLE